jgi:hemolysin III
MSVQWLKQNRSQTYGEELANTITHALGILFSFTTLILLTSFALKQHNNLKIASSLLFAITLIAVYTTSTLYHSCQMPGRKRFFKMLDHIAIYMLIAGTYTPFALIILHGTIGWILFSCAWGIVAIGIPFKLFFTGRLEKISTLLYLLMGWMSLLAIKPIYHNLPHAGFEWLAAGGFIYTFGVIFYSWKRLYFSHTLWHLCVLAGSFCHVIAIRLYVLPS